MPADRGRALALLGLQRLRRLGAAAQTRLLAAVDSGAELFALGRSGLEALAGRRLGGPWEPLALAAAAESDLRLLERLGARFVQRDEPGFPAALREIPAPPFGLYLRGADLPAALPAVAVVGTRYPTGLGASAARRFGRELASAGLAVVSGLARGVDAEAHRGALESMRGAVGAPAGTTCAVLPCGIETAYPAMNRGLAASILASGGLLVSEFPPGSAVHRSNFPERNRIISGLARGVLVVEAPAGSGALITADFALEQGRDVFAAASRLGGPQSAGLDGLVADGAQAVAGAAGLLGEWGLALPAARPAGGADRRVRPVGSAETGLRLAEALRAELGLLGSGARSSPAGGGRR
ncbi:MAG: DNA-protecting protein DprA [Spirochaetaceae bacterium]|nr:DNA-protecting protein DprA [Spirochaetaceae bacterium]